jgi:general secretion pathway protein E
VPFDEMASLCDPGVTLTSGATFRVPPAHRPAAIRALNPPATGSADDGAALVRYITGGAWSPGRAASILLAMATAAGASDVHIEAEESGYRVRLRVAGALSDFSRLPPAAGRRLLAAFKHAAGCLPYRSDIVQEGRIPREGVAADVRASFLPTALGERAALRLFGRLLSIEDLGLAPELRRRFENLLAHRSGLVLVAGPSGGGKTTTVYAALAHLAARRDGAHLSIEDPVEQRLRLAGVPVDQVELCPERGLTAEVALVGALRQDVDVVALGEIRTEGEAQLALRAAHTGRLVVAGVHAGSAAEARRRMLDLGVEEAVLDETLRGVLHQRLETVVCADHGGEACESCGGVGRLRRPVCRIWEPS